MAFLDPQDISIQFLEGSNIIQFFNELGIKLDIFYRMLWRHILSVEFIKLRYNLRSESQNRSLLNRIYEFVSPDSIKKKAFEYFAEWGDKFWIDTDEQLREITQRFTDQVEANLATKGASVDFSLKGAKSLDEEWAESETRYRFARALIEETKAIRRIPQIKVISALRRDLLDMVFDRTRGAGFQEEKYESYLLPLQWSRADLLSLVELRVKEVFRRQYTTENVRFLDVFPSAKKGGGNTSIDYVTDRTLRRPRDVLQFLL